MQQPPEPRRASSVLFLATAAVLFALMAMLAKGAATRLPGPEVAFIRFLVGVIACCLAATRRPMRANNASFCIVGALITGVPAARHWVPVAGAAITLAGVCWGAWLAASPEVPAEEP